MKIKTLLFLAFFPVFLFAQSFLELCESDVINGTIVHFERFQDEIYATGFFNQICGSSIDYLAKWNGDSWDPVESGLTDPGHSLFATEDTLFIARYEESIDSNWLYIYTESGISKFGEGIYLTTASGFSELPNLYDVIRFQGQIVACGEFDRVGQQSISGIMRWNGSQWEGLGSGLAGNIPNTAPVMFPHQLLIFEEKLYVSGNFGQAGGLTANGIARWDGTAWESLGAGFNGTVYAMGEFQGELYAAGAFTKSGTQDLNRIAKWNGTEWVSPGFGFIPLNSNDFAFVHTLKTIDDQLHIAGGLKKIQYDDGSTLDCGGIIAFDGNNINTFEGGVSGFDIEAIIKRDSSTLMIGGGVFNAGYLGESAPVTSIHEVSDNSSLSIFPNPTFGKVQIKGQGSYSQAAIQVFSPEGRLLGHYEKVGRNEELDLSNLDAGLYLVKIITGQGITSQKLIIH